MQGKYPYAQDMRLRCICSTMQAIENGARDLTDFLAVSNRVFVQQQIQRVRLVTMEGALKPHLPKRNERQCTDGSYIPSKPIKNWGYTLTTSLL